VDEKTQKPISKKVLILSAVAISIIMYIAGVFSGLYANKITEHKVTKELTRVEQDIEFLKSKNNDGC
jgi:cell division protein FtsL